MGQLPIYTCPDCLQVQYKAHGGEERVVRIVLGHLRDAKALHLSYAHLGSTPQLLGPSGVLRYGADVQGGIQKEAALGSWAPKQDRRSSKCLEKPRSFIGFHRF